MKRYFEYQDAQSSKFREITRQGTEIVTHYGKIGTELQAQYLEGKYDYYLPDSRKIRQHTIAGTPIFKNTG